MNKAILVIDMPDNCDNCPCFQFGMDNYCAVTNNTVYDYWKKRDANCPLKPVPEKVYIQNFDDIVKAESDNAYEVGLCMYDRGHIRGYNLCIDKILGT